MKKKKVVFFVTTLGSGGLENYLLRFLRAYSGKIECIVFCKGGRAGVLEEEYNKIGVKIIINKIQYLNPISWYRLFKWLKRKRNLTVCDFTGPFAGIPLFLAKLAKIKKRVVFYRGSQYGFKNISLLKHIYYLIIQYIVEKNATRILFNSHAGEDFFYQEGHPMKKKSKVIYNAMDAKSFFPCEINCRKELNIPPSAFVIGHVGRFDPSKNHKTMMKVAVELCIAYQDIYFIFCGHGVQISLKDHVEKAGLSEKIILLEYRNDINYLLNTLNIFYFPSLTEGQPNALIESMFCGVPFVASNIKAIKEIVPEVLHEQLMDPFDINRAKNIILNLYNHPEIKTQLLCTEWAKDFFCPKKQYGLFFDEL